MSLRREEMYDDRVVVVSLIVPVPIIPIIVVGGVAAAVGYLVGRRPKAEVTPHQDAPLTGRASMSQCVKIALLVWNRANGEQAHQLIRLLTGRPPSEYWGRSGERSREPQICYIARLVWHRASGQQASELIRALETLPDASPPRKPPTTHIRGLLQSEAQAPWNPAP